MPDRTTPPVSPTPSADCDWAVQECGAAHLGDRRRTRRLVDLGATLVPSVFLARRATRQ